MVTFRPTTADDAESIALWIAQDPDHNGRMEAKFFLPPDWFTTFYCIEDELGPVIFVRQEVLGSATVLHTQFPPFDRKRIARALEDAYPLVAADAKARGFSKIQFESGSIALVRFMFRFGFRAQLVADL